MSILEKDKVDGIGISKDANKIVLMISDHLDWENEYEHLVMLQDKINIYISFIENEQVREIYPQLDVTCYIIKVYFKYMITEKCLEFLNYVNKVLAEIHASIEAELPQESE